MCRWMASTVLTVEVIIDIEWCTTEHGNTNLFRHYCMVRDDGCVAWKFSCCQRAVVHSVPPPLPFLPSSLVQTWQPWWTPSKLKATKNNNQV